MVNFPYTSAAAASPGPDRPRLAGRVVEAAATVLSLGTNRLVRRSACWLKRNGLARYVVPALLLNEAFGAYRVYVAAGMSGWW